MELCGLIDNIEMSRRAPFIDVEEDNQVSVGSVSGGGRYDNLVNMFSQSSDSVIPCVGLSIGVERLMAVYEKTQSADDSVRVTKPVMVITAQKNMVDERLKLLSMLLDAGIVVIIDSFCRPCADFDGSSFPGHSQHEEEPESSGRVSGMRENEDSHGCYHRRG